MNNAQRGGIPSLPSDDLIKRCGTAAASTLGAWPLAGSHGVWSAGSDAPEKREVRVGFLPLTDCASIVIASLRGFDRRYGIKIIPTREASWAAVRDKLLNGVLDAAQVLYGLVYGVQMGIGGPKRDMAVLMTLNQNGQGITFSRRLQELGVTTGDTLRRRLGTDHRLYTLAHTFPTGTHALWLYYWLAAHGIDPLSDVHTIVVPPPQMVSHLRSGKVDGACVGEPWNALAIREQVGFTVANSQDVWADHPEKALGTTREFVQRYPNTARALVMAVLDASRYVDTLGRRSEVARIIAARPYVDAPVEAVEARLRGEYDDGIGKGWHDPHHLSFYRDGQVNFPYLSDGMWFLTQHRRWGLLHRDPDYLAVARQIQQIEIYRQAAAQTRVPVPDELVRRSRLIDGIPWDGTDPCAYARGFSIQWRSKPLAAEA